MKPKFIPLKMDPLFSTHHQGQHQYYESSVHLKKKKQDNSIQWRHGLLGIFSLTLLFSKEEVLIKTKMIQSLLCSFIQLSPFILRKINIV